MNEGVALARGWGVCGGLGGNVPARLPCCWAAHPCLPSRGLPQQGLSQAEGCLVTQGGSRAPGWRGWVFLWTTVSWVVCLFSVFLSKSICVSVLCYLAESREILPLLTLVSEGFLDLWVYSLQAALSFTGCIVVHRLF